MLQWIYNRIEKSSLESDKGLKIALSNTVLFFATQTVFATFFFIVYLCLDLPEVVIVSLVNIVLYLFIFYLTLYKGNVTASVYFMVISLNYYVVWSTYFAGYDKNAIIIMPILILSVNSMFPIAKKHKNILTLFMFLVFFILTYMKDNITPKYFIELNFLHDVNLLFAITGLLFILYTSKVSEYYLKLHSEKNINSLTTEVNTDYLTGLANRRFLEEKIHEEGFLKNSYIVLADIDFFKKVNDTYGHSAGDTVLRKLSNIYSSYFRESDVVCRWGGEEFIFIIRKINEYNIEQKLDNLRGKIQKHLFVHEAEKIKITVSFGVCTVNPMLDVKKNIELADKAMYHAKKTGRNKVVFYEKI